MISLNDFPHFPKFLEIVDVRKLAVKVQISFGYLPQRIYPIDISNYSVMVANGREEKSNRFPLSKGQN